MKSHTLAASLLAIAAQSMAQLTSLPPCALQPALAAVGSTNCDATNVACICADNAFFAQLAPKIQAACSAEDLTKALAAAQTLCLAAGVTPVLPDATTAAAVREPTMTAGMAAPMAYDTTTTSPVSLPTTSTTTMGMSTTMPMSTDMPTTSPVSLPATTMSGSNTMMTSATSWITTEMASVMTSSMATTAMSTESTMSASMSTTPAAYTGGAAVSWKKGAMGAVAAGFGVAVVIV